MKQYVLCSEHELSTLFTCPLLKVQVCIEMLEVVHYSSFTYCKRFIFSQSDNFNLPEIMTKMETSPLKLSNQLFWVSQQTGISDTTSLRGFVTPHCSCRQWFNRDSAYWRLHSYRSRNFIQMSLPMRAEILYCFTLTSL